MARVISYRDPTHQGNGLRYRTGQVCGMRDCDRAAGTAWEPGLCFEHSVEVMDERNTLYRRAIFPDEVTR